MANNIAAIGRTDKSRFKHHFFASVLHMLGVLGKCRVHRRPALFDITAGDGNGVLLHSGGFFFDQAPPASPSTAESMYSIAAQVRHTDVRLYEKDSLALAQLRQRFSGCPQVSVIPNNRNAYLHVSGYDYLVVVIDYNGAREYAGKYGIHKRLKQLCREAPTDFDLIIIFNEAAVYPLLAEISPDWDETVQDSFHTNHDWYPQTLDPNYFATELEMPHLACSPPRKLEVFKASGRYGFRMLVLSRQPLGDRVGRWNGECKLRERGGGRQYRVMSNGFDKWWFDEDFLQFNKRFEVIR